MSEKAKGKKIIEDLPSSSGESPWIRGDPAYYGRKQRKCKELEHRIRERLRPLKTRPVLRCDPSMSTKHPAKTKKKKI
jgi:hypothetical protein